MQQQTWKTQTIELVDVNPPLPVLAQTSTGDLTATLVGLVMTGVAVLIVVSPIVWLLNSIVRICDPNKILVISGKEQSVKGAKTGYKVLTGGLDYCLPILHTVQAMDMRTMPVPIEVTNAYAKGGTPLNIQAIANVKISRDPAIVRNAIERFLGRNPSEIRRVARETLEGNLRGVVATLTPEQLNEDRLEFADRIAKDVRDDLSKLGLQLDTLKIQSVADEVEYLDSISRRQIALILRDAEIAESDAIAEAEAIEAESKRQAEVARTQATTLIQTKQNELRRIKAELDQRTRSEEERTQAAAQEARAKAQQRLQTIRSQLERLRLEADEVLPAEAQRQARELQAQGEAAPLAEDARAAAMVNDLLSKVWQESGANASDLFALQQLEMILRQSAQVADRLHLSRVNAIDSGDGKTLAGLVNVYPQVVREFLNQVEQTLDLNLMGSSFRSMQNSEPLEPLAAPETQAEVN
jgi:flotillin